MNDFIPVPSHYEKLPIISIAKKDGGLFVDGDWIESKDISDSGFRYLTTGNVGLGEFKHQGDGYVSEETFRKLRCTEVFPGDILVSRLNLPIGRACLVPDIGERMVTSVDNVIMRPSSEFHRGYLVYLFSAHHHTEMMSNLARGTTMLRVSRGALGRARVFVPPLSEQTAIASFLDRETARIDGLIEKKGRFIALLKDKEKASISALVRRGADEYVEFVDSGVEWRGPVPAHWRRARMKNLFRQVKRQGYDGLTVLSVYREFGVIEKTSRDDNINKTPEDLSKYQLVEPGDLAINKMKAWQGSMGISDLLGITSPDYVVMTPVEQHHPRYIHHYLRAQPMPWVYMLISNGIRTDQWRLEPEKFLELPVFLPPLDEQAAIADKIDAVLLRLRSLVARTERSIELLKEKRAALITAAVTGKIDVRSAA